MESTVINYWKDFENHFEMHNSLENIEFKTFNTHAQYFENHLKFIPSIFEYLLTKFSRLTILYDFQLNEILNQSNGSK